MIIAAWKPKLKGRNVIYYEKFDIKDLDYNSSGHIKIIYKCDNSECKHPDKIYSINFSHLKNAKNKKNYHAKNTMECQICRSCGSNGKNNGMYGRTHTEEVKNKLRETAFKEYNNYLTENFGVSNTSHLEEIKNKKGQVIINEENAKDLCNNLGLEFISIDGNNKYAKVKVKCEHGHVFSRKWHSLRKRFKSCLECFYNELSKQGIKNKTGFRLYHVLVYRYTSRTVNHYAEFIDNLELRSRQWHLDHKYSICEGFKHNIPPYIIGSYHNLEIINGIENMKKQSDCSMSKEELFDKYFLGEYKWN